MIKFLSALIFSLLIPLSASAAEYSDGNGYTTIKTPVRTSDPNKIEVTEIFWYGCPHCYSLEPLVQAWKKDLPSDVDFKYLPAVFGRGWLAHAKAFYVADLLGMEDKIRADLFNAIHVERRNLNSEDALARFFADYGVNEDDFRKQYDSFAVNSRLSQADAKIRAYGARGVPGIIVNGKYLVSAESANGNENIFKVVDFLIEQERQK
ncbi:MULTISPECIES: thiol:disulfide interchange protein DsbA/DsbL [Marinomonas]|uniref:Thiol:disulfide interchange protein n=1 Tax=Marinomonas arctica TaxID=383750 RepID=A0A7H1J559_9GAMM|nr:MULTISPECIES: thiol:disulfide interchange protein DsbA/DsbL [Marinomonas]MCS7486330.1 DSBA oxidoreductase [Marinomonas sp. BSi20414]QNT05625.1 thiol:disulfide interchange protein DsbA/DsbL [Marinomonas arctica]GGN29798.1 thiol:disulfide interchange protein DsbA [Marinomonas arctica]